jgi:antitoxin (DNA-binding transcriptional repressor) of toxin-antitoxin stability system
MMCNIKCVSQKGMPILNARELHNETSAVLDEVAKGKTFEIQRNGKTIGRLEPVIEEAKPGWDEIMAPVWALRKKNTRKQRNPVLDERARKRR